MKNLDKKLEKIVKERYSYIGTLEEQGCDELDFIEVTTWGLKELLMNAYELGKKDALKEIEKNAKNK